MEGCFNMSDLAVVIFRVTDFGRGFGSPFIALAVGSVSEVSL
jgi:hypothetical protein